MGNRAANRVAVAGTLLLLASAGCASAADGTSGFEGSASRDATAWQHQPIWNDGKAEVSVYSATEVKYGVPRESTFVHVVVAEDLRRDTMVKSDDPSPPGGLIRVLKSNQQWDIPTGTYDYRQMASVFLAIDDLYPVKETFTSHELCGNTFLHMVSPRGDRSKTTIRVFSYFDGIADATISLDSTGVQAYDALPVALRALPFREGHASTLRLLSSFVTNRGNKPAVSDATVEVEGTEDVNTGLGKISAWKVIVGHAGGRDALWFEREMPRRLVRWEQADGGRYTLENSRRLQYWRLNRPGDEAELLAKE